MAALAPSGRPTYPAVPSPANLASPAALARPEGAFFLAWIILLIAGLFEVGWAAGLKQTEGFTRLMPTVLTVLSMVASLGMLGVALRTLPLGTAYAVWTGVGTVGTALLGVVLYGEPATAARLGCIGLIVAGIAGLKLLSPE